MPEAAHERDPIDTLASRSSWLLRRMGRTLPQTLNDVRPGYDLDTVVIRLRAFIVGVGDLIAGVLIGWFPGWHNSASLVKYGGLVGHHWSILGSLLIASALLIAYPRTRAVGYGITSFIWLVGGFFLLDVSVTATRNNALAVVGMFMLGGIVLCGVITAQTDRGRRGGP